MTAVAGSRDPDLRAGSEFKVSFSPSLGLTVFTSMSVCHLCVCLCLSACPPTCHSASLFLYALLHICPCLSLYHESDPETDVTTLLRNRCHDSPADEWRTQRQLDIHNSAPYLGYEELHLYFLQSVVNLLNV